MHVFHVFVGAYKSRGRGACPHACRASFTGKEGYPTLGFNVTVDHDMRVLHVCSMFAGRFNDETKVLYDTYVKRLREGFYDGFSFNLRDSEGVETTSVNLGGAHGICHPRDMTHVVHGI